MLKQPTLAESRLWHLNSFVKDIILNRWQMFTLLHTSVNESKLAIKYSGASAVQTDDIKH